MLCVALFYKKSENEFRLLRFFDSHRIINGSNSAERISMKSAILFMTAFFVSSITLADSMPLWQCTASNQNNQYWYEYGKTHDEARFAVERLCKDSSKHQTCDVVCIPPRVYWRCVSHDTPVTPKNPIGTWYWSSYSQVVAENGARDACRHNSQNGGCYVDNNACVSS